MSDPQSTNILFVPGEARRMVGVEEHTLKRWAKTFAAHLSESAASGAGRSARYTARDIEILQAIKALRDQDVPLEAIPARLSAMHFGEIVEATDNTPITSLQTTETRTESTPAPIAVYQDVAMLKEQIAALQRNRRDVWVAFMVGVIVAGVFMLVIILLFVLFGGSA
jgi:DNA-binding transcriptional MerR regulator